MSKIRADELDERLDGGDVFVLDVRPAANYDREHIAESYNAPVYDALRGGDTGSLNPHLDAIPRNTAVVTVCKAGIVAKRATEHLESEGYDAATLAGGFAGWKRYRDGSLGYRIISFVRGLLE